MLNAFIIITDSGGVQEEASVLGKPVVIIRKKTEHFINIDGTKSDLKYNNRYINPQEIYADNFNIEKLLSHLIESLTILRSLKIN